MKRTRRRHWFSIETSALALVALTCLSLRTPSTTDGPSASVVPRGADDPLTQSFSDLGLTLKLPPLTELMPGQSADPQVQKQWNGKLGSLRVEISLAAFQPPKFEMHEPSELCALIEQDLREARQDRRFGYDFEPKSFVPGAFGFAPYATLSRAGLRAKNETKVTGSFFMLCGLLKEGAYAVRVTTQPQVGAAEEKTLLEFLKKGVVYAGEVRNAKWSNEQVQSRWKHDTEKVTKNDLEPPLRTAHYIVLTDSNGGKQFGDHMEECYAAIKKLYPFDEVAGRALMPVFLFRTPDEYFAFYAKVQQVSLDEARRSKGHASGDYYATWYEAVGDSVHIHEATHQIFGNRLDLGGGGSWFQEGVAEYVSSKPNERGNAAREVKKGRQMPLEQLVAVPSLLYSTSGEDKKSNEASDNYKLAALLIEFLRESKWGKDKFQSFIHAVGVVRRNDVKAIEAAVKAVYGTDLEGLEAKWVEYCKTR